MCRSILNGTCCDADCGPTDRTVPTSGLLCTSIERRKGNEERKIKREREREARPLFGRRPHLSLALFLAFSLSLSLSISRFPNYLSLSLSLSLSLACRSYLSLSLSLSISLSFSVSFSYFLCLSISPPLLALTAEGLGGVMRHSATDAPAAFSPAPRPMRST